MISPSFIDSSAAALAAAWSTATITEPPFAARAPDRDQAYAIQDRMVQLLESRLGPRVGWKLGMTAPDIVDEPIVGPIHQAMLIPSGSSLPASPGMLIELEIALHIRPGVDPENLTTHDLEVGAAFELLGRRTRSRETCDGIADLATMHHVVLGPARPLASLPDLGDLTGTLAIHGETIAAGVCRQAVKPPFDLLQWLRPHLARRGRRLLPGEVVITGSLVGQVAVQPEAVFTGDIGGLAPVMIRFEA